MCLCRSALPTDFIDLMFNWFLPEQYVKYIGTYIYHIVFTYILYIFLFIFDSATFVASKAFAGLFVYAKTVCSESDFLNLLKFSYIYNIYIYVYTGNGSIHCYTIPINLKVFSLFFVHKSVPHHQTTFFRGSA